MTIDHYAVASEAPATSWGKRLGNGRPIEVFRVEATTGGARCAGPSA